MTYLVPPPASPTPPLAPAPEPSAVSIRGKALVVPKNYAFPRICIVTGETEDLIEVRRKLSWHSPAVYFLILINLLIYIIVAMIVRKTSDHTFYLAREERNRRRKWQATGWAAFLAGIAAIFVGAMADAPLAFLATVLLLIASLVIYFTKVRLIAAERVTETSASLLGISPAVMQELAST